MTITILTDNFPGNHTAAEHGLSYLIEHDGKKLLFDTGQSDLFLKNAYAMGIDITEIDMIILSHGHFDHGNGLEHLSGGFLVCHPGCFVKRYRKKDNSYIGLKNTKDEISGKFNLILAEKPYKICDNIFFSGEIPRVTGFESQSTPFVFENGAPDLVIDDSATGFLLKEGMFVVTGCGHSGIVNTLEHMKKITGTDKIYGIMGGFHLKEIDRQTRETIQYLRENNIQHVYPSHCTALPVLLLFLRTFNSEQVVTGKVFEF
jgi:7,8-dihydropterin-6-yl-methyl-4-(beta-D-ribofuranosyl)aminobenzene 5'-phosphate synthase